MGRVHRKQKVCSPRSRPTAAKRNVLRKATAATGELIHSPRRAAAVAARAATGELIHSPTSTATAAKRNVQTTANPKQEADGKRRRLWGKTSISSKEGKPWADAGVSPESLSIVPLIVQPQLPPESSSIVPSIVQPQLPPESSSIVPEDGPQLPACRRAHPIQSPATAAAGELIHSRSPRASRRSLFGKLTGRRSCRCIAIDLE